ncbi:MAG TPA: hypothetical protein PLT47_11725 [Bacteroidales bacterium]|nr:hypothetical protein [Bacteroidales bacterium]
MKIKHEGTPPGAIAEKPLRAGGKKARKEEHSFGLFGLMHLPS